MLFDDVPMCIDLYALQFEPIAPIVLVEYRIFREMGCWHREISVGHEQHERHCYLELRDLDPATHAQRAADSGTTWARSVARCFRIRSV